MERMPRPGTAIHLQEVFHREQMKGSPAPGIPPCAHELRAVWPTRSGSKEECPKSRESRDEGNAGRPKGHLSEGTSEHQENGEVRNAFCVRCAALCSRA